MCHYGCPDCRECETLLFCKSLEEEVIIKRKQYEEARVRAGLLLQLYVPVVPKTSPNTRTGV